MRVSTIHAGPGKPVPLQSGQTAGFNAYRSGLYCSLSVLLPAVGVLLLLPMVIIIGMSVCWPSCELAGFRFLFSDSALWRSLWLSALYASSTVVIQVALGTFAAAVVQRLGRGTLPVTIALFLPYAVPSVVVIVIWQFLIRDHGFLAVFLERALGISTTFWMGEGVFWTLVIVSAWQFYPFVFVTLLAGMRRIPPDLYRSAQVDGAGTWQQFWFVTLPQIRLTLFSVIVLRIAFMFTKFDTPFLLAGSTANDRAQTLPVYIYFKCTENLASLAGTPAVAGALFMAVILGVLISMLYWLLPRWNGALCMPAPRMAGAGRILVCMAFIALLAFSVLPYAALLVGSLLPDSRTDRGICTGEFGHLSLENFGAIRQTFIPQCWPYFFNTLIVSGCTAAIVLFISVLGGFALTRYRLRKRDLLQKAIIWGYLMPPIVLVFPGAALLSALGWIGTRWGLILANTAFCLPFGLWLIISYFEQVNLSLDRAAAVDGASWWQTLCSVLIPRAFPGIAAVAMFAFILSWNDVALSLVLSDETTRTIAHAVNEVILKTPDATSYSTFAAASLLVATPAVLIFGFVQWWIDCRLRRENQTRSL